VHLQQGRRRLRLPRLPHRDLRVSHTAPPSPHLAAARVSGDSACLTRRRALALATTTPPRRRLELGSTTGRSPGCTALEVMLDPGGRTTLPSSPTRRRLSSRRRLVDGHRRQARPRLLLAAVHRRVSVGSGGATGASTYAAGGSSWALGGTRGTLGRPALQRASARSRSPRSAARIASIWLCSLMARMIGPAPGVAAWRAIRRAS
jgi:hypothetical protein